jgi:hypothetical protein
MLKLIFATAAIAGLLLGGTGVGKAKVEKPSTPSMQTEARCPLIYAPVICDKGVIYPNQCVADSRHAKNCVPCGGECL